MNRTDRIQFALTVTFLYLGVLGIANWMGGAPFALLVGAVLGVAMLNTHNRL